MFLYMRIAVTNVLANSPIIVELVFELITDLHLLAVIIIQTRLSQIGLARNLAKFSWNNGAIIGQETTAVMCQIKMAIAGQNSKTGRFIRLVLNTR
ncbi:hypothetical protein D3C80_1714650 [compost metagenome]